MTDAAAFNKIATEIFAPVYPVIAEQIAEETGIRDGVCLDIGAGCGHLGIAMARNTDCRICMIDPSQEMRDIAWENVTAAGLEDRVFIMHGQAESISLDDNAVDLAISRGSVFFWKDWIQAFREIFRVLAPGGAACIGGGFGNAEIAAEITRKMNAANDGNGEWMEKVARRTGPDAVSAFEKALEAADIPDFTVQSEPGKGIWILMRKGGGK